MTVAVGLRSKTQRPRARGEAGAALLLSAMLTACAVTGAEAPVEPVPRQGPPVDTAPRAGAPETGPLYVDPDPTGRPMRIIGRPHRAGHYAYEPPLITVITPLRSGWTTRSQPSVFVYTSQPLTGPISVVVMDANDHRLVPLADIRFDDGLTQGLNKFDFAAYDIELDLSGSYIFSLTAELPQTTDGVLQQTTQGGLVYGPERPGLQAELSQLTPESQVNYLLQQRLWYDAVEAIVDFAAAEPNNPHWPGLLTQVLYDVGLDEITDDLQISPDL